MKILQLSLVNLNSLRGEHRVDFERAPLQGCGLFAITGPTGSGKTTLLDALTLALYGRAVRFGKSSPDEIMTRGETESFAEVTFSTFAVQSIQNGVVTTAAEPKIYKARWSRRRTRTGTLQAPRRELAEHPSGIILASQSSDVNDQVERITGLDFDRFQKSVLLAQGEFAAFLRANPEDRKALLEKITGTEIYAELEELAKVTAETKRRELQDLQSLMNSAPPLTESELQQKQDALEAAEAEIRRHAELLGQLREAASRRHQLDELTATHRSRVERHESAAAAFAAESVAWQRLEADIRVRPLDSKFRELHRISSEILPLQQQLTQMEAAVAQRAGAARDAETALLRAKGDLDEIRRRRAERMPVLDEMVAADAELNQSRAALRSQRQAVAAHADKAKAAERELKAAAERKRAAAALLLEAEAWRASHSGYAVITAQLDKLEQRCERVDAANARLAELSATLQKTGAEAEQLQKTLDARKLQRETAQSEIVTLETSARSLADKSAALLRGRSAAQLEAERDQQRDLSALQEKAFAAAQRLTECSARVTQEKQSLASAETKITEYQHAKAEAERRLPAAHEREQLLREKFDLERRVVNLEAEREQLREGKECPVCGSLDHPFARHAPAPDLSASEKQLLKAQKLIEELNLAAALSVRELAAATRAAEESRTRIAKAEASRNAAHIELQQLCASSGAWREICSLNESPDILTSQEKQDALIQQLQSIGKELSASGKKLSADWEAFRALDKKVSETRRRIEEAHRNASTLLIDTERLQQRSETFRARVEELRSQSEVVQSHHAEALEEIAHLLSGSDLSLPVAYRVPSAPSLCAKWFPTLQKHADEWTARTLQKTALEQAAAEALSREQSAAEVERLVRAAHVQQHSELLAAEEHLAQQEAARTKRYGTANPVAERKELSATLEAAEKRKDAAETAFAEASRQATEAAAKQTHTRDALKSSRDREAAARQDLEAACEAMSLSMDEARSALLEPQERTRLDALHQRLTSEQSAAAHEAQTAESRLRQASETALREAPLSQQPLAELAIQTKSAEEKIADLNQDKGRLRGELDRDASMRSAMADAIARSSAAEKESTRWGELARVLGHGTRKPFSRFAQNLTLSRLTALANGHLSRLSDRYRLERRMERDMELEIVDGYQANSRRTIESLSGGETFLVSLALALGLSELASRRVRIDSLFIDEGFGSLDADTLDVAIGVLENLQADGKMVGIISHVELIRERISTRIMVQRLGGGYSTLTLQPDPGDIAAEAAGMLLAPAPVSALPAALPQTADAVELPQSQDLRQPTLL
ncbi:MAG: AAA family ATPase [Candidatus Methylacidiphilales bacterium]